MAIAFVLTTTIANTETKDIDPDNCENKRFNNAYYLIDKADIYPATIFYQDIDAIDSDLNYGFESHIGQREIINTYYDFDNQDVLNANKELVYILDDGLPNYFKEREQVKYVDRLNVYDNSEIFEVKKYNKKISSLDKHSLFSRIKRKQRPVLIDNLSIISSDSPVSISEALKIKSVDNFHLIVLYAVPYGAITLSRFSIYDYGLPNTSFLLKIEKYNDIESKLSEHEKESLDIYLCRLENNFQMRFPHIKSVSSFGYAEYYQSATAILPSREFFRKYPEIFSVGQIIILSFIGFLFIYLILGRYSKQEIYSKISKSNTK